MKPPTKLASKPFNKHYTVAIDTVPLPENPHQRVRLVMDQITPVLNRIIGDAMTVAIGTWPTPEIPRKNLENTNIE